MNSRLLYFVWLAIALTWIIVSAVAFSDFVVSGREDASVALGILNAIFIVYLYLAIRKYVYLVQGDENRILVRNLFIKEIANRDEIEISKIRIMSHTYRLKYKDKIYWVLSYPSKPLEVDGTGVE